MTKLEEILERLCPDEVEYRKLGDIFVQYNGMTGVSNKWADSGNCLFIDYLNVYKNSKVDTLRLENATVKKLDQNIIHQYDILLTCASETPDECAISAVVEDAVSSNVFLDDHLFGLHLREEFIKSVNTIFVNYYMQTDEFRKSVSKAVRGVTRFYISNDAFMKLEIPLPPLEAQREIVHILDEFTLLTAELTAELTARQKQYNYYRDLLLNFENKTSESINFIELSKTNKLLRGSRLTSRDIKLDGKFDVFHGGIDPLGKYDKFNRTGDTVMIINVGASAGLVGYSKEAFWSSDGCFCLEHSDKYLNKFLYYYLLTKEHYLQSRVRKAGIPTLDNSVVEKIKVPIISLERQKEIVTILDKFDIITKDISVGLPAEIAARQKQYEYYRDKLLTFKRLEA